MRPELSDVRFPRLQGKEKEESLHSPPVVGMSLHSRGPRGVVRKSLQQAT